MGDPTSHYAESLTVMPGPYFRLITRAGHGDPDRGPEPVVRRGTFTNRAGCRWEVDSCDGDAADLIGARPMAS